MCDLDWRQGRCLDHLPPRSSYSTTVTPPTLSTYWSWHQAVICTHCVRCCLRFYSLFVWSWSLVCLLAEYQRAHICKKGIVGYIGEKWPSCKCYLLHFIVKNVSSFTLQFHVGNLQCLCCLCCHVLHHYSTIKKSPVEIPQNINTSEKEFYRWRCVCNGMSAVTDRT